MFMRATCTSRLRMSSTLPAVVSNADSWRIISRSMLASRTSGLPRPCAVRASAKAPTLSMTSGLFTMPLKSSSRCWRSASCCAALVSISSSMLGTAGGAPSGAAVGVVPGGGAVSNSIYSLLTLAASSSTSMRAILASSGSLERDSLRRCSLIKVSASSGLAVAMLLLRRVLTLPMKDSNSPSGWALPSDCVRRAPTASRDSVAGIGVASGPSVGTRIR